MSQAIDPTLPNFEPVVYFTPVNTNDLIFLIFCLAFMLFGFASLVVAMGPYRAQKKRELTCNHEFDRYVTQQPGKPQFFTYFCKKCGARHVICNHEEIGMVRNPKSRSRKAAK